MGVREKIDAALQEARRIAVVWARLEIANGMLVGPHDDRYQDEHSLRWITRGGPGFSINLHEEREEDRLVEQ